MKIKKIKLKNGYKRFHNLTIDLGDNPKRIIALVGPNGCGKSSVLDGMLYHHNVHRKIGDKKYKDNTYHAMNQATNFNYQSIEIEFEEGNYNTIRDNKKGNTIFSFRSPYRYNSSLKINQTKAMNDIKLNDYGATTASDLDDKMEQSYRRLYIKYNNYLNSEDCKPSEAKAKIIGDLNKALVNCLDLEVSSIGSIEDNKGTLFFKKTDHPTEFEFNVLSAGEKEVVDIILDLYLRQEEFNDSIFLIDEPELHINTAIQKKLLIEINSLVGDNCQIWITTHSIGFLRALQEDLKDDSDIIYFQSGTNWASEPQILTPIKKTLSNWKNIFETALDDLTGLISPKRIVYCEGKDKPTITGQEKGFDAQVFNNIFGEKYHNTLFVSSGGNTELDQRSEIALSILSKVFNDLEIWVLKDRDMASGKVTNESDRIIYLNNNPTSHRVLKRWEIENYLYDKEVLKKYCDKNQKEFDETVYDNLVNDINNDNLKDVTGKIKNICSITGSINPERFKLSISEVISEDMNIFRELEEVIFNRK